MSQSTSSGRPGRSALRRDLQGMRGLGVAFVVVGHLWQWPEGSFAVMDMFFVLSGFLITPILVEGFREHGGRFAVVFYLNRFRRLVPAAALVIVVSTALFYAVYTRARADQVATDGLWALGFMANWHFLAVGADYFGDHSPSPFVHYWSLSVEEQFYAVWPFLVLTVIALARWRSRKVVAALLAALALVSAISFGYSLWHSQVSPLGAYFSTFDRIWEFGIGGALGLLSQRFARLPLRVGAALGWIGFVGIVAVVFLVPLGLAFPAPWGLLPVLLTGAILVGGIGRDTRYLPMLDNPVMVYLGDISYSLYLWHLPLAVLLTAWFPLGDPPFYVFAIALSFGAAIATYHLVERPLRRARFLMTPPERARLRHRSRTKVRRSRRVGLLALIATLVLATFVVGSQRWSPAQFVEPTLPAAAAPVLPAPDTLLGEQQDRIARAVNARSFPDLSPGLDQLGGDSVKPALADAACTDVSAQQVADCSWGGGDRVAAVVGDSYAMAWLPGIRSALEPRGWTVQALTLSTCPAWTLPSYLTSDGSPYPECAEHHRLVADWLKENHPDLLILASSAENVRNADRGDLSVTQQEVAQTGLGETLREWSPQAGRTVVLGSPPLHVDLQTCITRFAVPSNCTTPPDQHWRAMEAGESAAAAAARVVYVHDLEWFCYMDRCPGFVGRTPVTYDGYHLTVQYSRELAPLLRHALLKQGQVRATDR